MALPFVAGTTLHAADLNLLLPIRTINAQTGTSYTLVLADGSQAGLNPIVSCANAAAITVTLPLNSSVAFPIGTEILIIQDGVGAVTISPAVGVTVNSIGGSKTTAGQYAAIALIQEATNVWYLIGALA